VILGDRGLRGAELSATYTSQAGWVEVLVDCPGTQGLFTYAIPAGMVVQPGDVVSVPFGSQQVGAIAIRHQTTLPEDLDSSQIRCVESVIAAGFFPTGYWDLLQRVASYYVTPFMQVVRAALPPGLLARSQRRIRLCSRPEGGLEELSPNAAALLTFLVNSKTKDYSWQFLQRQVKGASRAIAELVAGGWVESYLEPPHPPRPKLKQAVTLLQADNTQLTVRQQEILGILRRQGGEMWLTELLQAGQTTSATLKTLMQKGCVMIQPREVLRQEAAIAQTADTAKALTADQAQVLAKIQAVSGFAQVLLHGVTGSGKTEVYLQAIAPRLQAGKSILVLVPEIGLTPQLTDRFRARFGDQVCVYHSALSEGERYDTWRQMLTAQPKVVIGTRSAIFAPLSNLGLIVLDEEHDSSFKQDQPAPCYHARTVALWRGELTNCPVILGSATPSLESWVAVQGGGKAGAVQSAFPGLYLELPDRVHQRPLPAIEVVDMRRELQAGNRSIFGRSLQAALRSLQPQQQQGILFIHRRGYSTFVSCRSCGYVVTCPNCDVSMAYHQPHPDAVPLLRCHYCNEVQTVPDDCPSCHSTYFKYFGSGTQRVVQELQQHFPELRILRFDSDTTRTKGSHRALLSRFAQGEADLLVGTQMLTKGIDLPQVTLVGIVSADGLLHLPDYRANERAFQTLTQVAGRCGRGEEPGRVILQTYTPEHEVIQAVRSHAYRAFIETELANRAALRYPPCDRLILVRLSSENAVAVQKAADRVAEVLRPLEANGAELLGPAPAMVLRVARRYRWQILIKLPLDWSLPLPDINELRALCPNQVSLLMDIDPLSIG